VTLVKRIFDHLDQDDTCVELIDFLERVLDTIEQPEYLKLSDTPITEEEEEEGVRYFDCTFLKDFFLSKGGLEGLAPILENASTEDVLYEAADTLY